LFIKGPPPQTIDHELLERPLVPSSDRTRCHRLGLHQPANVFNCRSGQTPSQSNGRPLSDRPLCAVRPVAVNVRRRPCWCADSDDSFMPRECGRHPTRGRGPAPRKVIGILDRPLSRATTLLRNQHWRRNTRLISAAAASPAPMAAAASPAPMAATAAPSPVAPLDLCDMIGRRRGVADDGAIDRHGRHA
jgi:hypothetical protein